jgi:hypothetical protein
MAVDDNGLEIAKALIQGTAIAFSSGSFKDSQGTSAFIIEGDSKKGRLVGVNVIPGEPSSQSACRSELGGVAGTKWPEKARRLEACDSFCRLRVLFWGLLRAAAATDDEDEDGPSKAKLSIAKSESKASQAGRI